MDSRGLIIFLVIGLVAGWLASFVVGGGGLVKYLLSGVVGAFVGGWLLSALNVNLGIANPVVSQILTATIGAIVVVLLARLIG